MKTSKQLKDERSSKLADQQTIVDVARNEKREMTDQENTDFDAAQTQIDALTKSIARSEKIEANERAAAAVAGNELGDGEKEEKEKILKRFSLSKALLSGARRETLDGAENEINQIAQDEARSAGIDLGEQSISIPASLMKRADGQTATLDSGANGAALIGTDIKLIEGLAPKLVVENLGVTMLDGLVGKVALPVVGDYTFQWLAEDADVTVQKTGIAGPTLDAKRAAATVPLSYQLLKQTSFSVEQMIVGRLGAGYAQALMTAIINGAGTADPIGILNKTNVQEAADSSAVAPTWAKVVELEALAKSANSQGTGYLMHPKTEAKLKTVSKDAGSGRFLIENGLLNGYPYAVTTAVPVLNTATIYPLIFGDFKEMFVGRWGGVSFLSDPYTGAKGNKVNIHVNAHADANIANPAAFAINTWLTF